MANRTHKDNPRAHCQAYFELSKKWFGAAFIAKFLVFAIGILAVLSAQILEFAPFLVFSLQIMAEFFSWCSDVNKGTGESLLRKLDAWDSFGWEISQAEISDLLARCPSSLDKLVFSKVLEEEYFASKEGVGTKRALQNIAESAWWSKHLAGSMSKYYFAATCVLLISSISILIFSIQTIKDVDTITSVGKTVTSTLMLIFSLGLFRAVLGYYNFSYNAERIEQKAENLLASSALEELDAIKVMNEYHIARNAAPLIPSWFWKLKRDNLNEVWSKYRHNQP